MLHVGAIMSYMTNEGMTRKQMALLALIEARSPMSIYQLAKAAGRPYRRVHDHVRELAASGRVTLKTVRQNNRRATLVVSNNVYHRRLMHLDEMYAAYRELSGGSRA